MSTSFVLVRLESSGFGGLGGLGGWVWGGWDLFWGGFGGCGGWSAFQLSDMRLWSCACRLVLEI